MKLITEQKLKDQHLYHIIDLDSKRCASTEKLRKLESVLEDIFQEPHSCENCGSIQPEIKLYHNRLCFTFSCVEISHAESQQILRATDYQRLYNYLFIKGYGPKTLAEVKAILAKAKVEGAKP